jgi:hypothetical protein
LALFNLQRDTLKLYWFRLSSPAHRLCCLAASAVPDQWPRAVLKQSDPEGVVQEAGKFDEATD